MTISAAGSGPATAPAQGGFLDLQGPAGLVAWKRSEADDGWVLRLRAGPGGGQAVLHLPWNPSGAWLTDLVEQPRAPLQLTGGTVTVPLQPAGVVTVLLKD